MIKPYILPVSGGLGLLFAGSSVAQVVKVKPKPAQQIEQQNKVSPVFTPPKDPNDQPVIPGQISSDPMDFDSSAFPEQSAFVQMHHKVMKVCDYDFSSYISRIETADMHRPNRSSGLSVKLTGLSLKNTPYEVQGGYSQSQTADKPLKSVSFRLGSTETGSNLVLYDDGQIIDMTVPKDNWDNFKNMLDKGKGVCFGVKYKLHKTRSGANELESARTNFWTAGECKCRTRR